MSKQFECQHVADAVDAAHPGKGTLINDAVDAGEKAGLTPSSVWAQIFAVLISNVGPQLIAALEKLIAGWLNPPTPAPAKT